MANYQYEKYVGYNQHELKYKKEITVDNTGNQVEKYVERTPEEVLEYKQQKELEFNNIKTNWERLGIKKCAWERAFDQKGFRKIYLKLVDRRLSELSCNNPTGDIETGLLNSIKDVYEKYHIGAAFKFYSVKDEGYTSTSTLFNGLSKSKIEKMFYSKMTTQTAGALARNRLAKSSTIEEGLAAIQELQRTHNSRSIFYKIFHPIMNANENNLIKEIKSEVMHKFNISKERLDRCLKKEIDTSKLSTSNLYKLSYFVDMHCKEKAGRIYSQEVMDRDRKDVARRAEDDFVDAQAELNRLIDNEVREPIMVDEANNNVEAERIVEPVREDPIIINVPNNDKF